MADVVTAWQAAAGRTSCSIKFRQLRGYPMKSAYALLCLSAAVLISATPPASAQGRDRFAIGGHGSTLGFGPELMFSVSPLLTVRAVGNYLSFDYDDTLAGIDYDLDVDLQSAGGFIDYHPMRNGFHLTVGALYNNNEAGLSALAPAGSSVGGITLPAAAGLRGDMTVDEFSPYLGLGYDTTFTSRSAWTFTVRAGVLYQNDLSVSLTQTSGPAIPQGNLDAEADDVESDLQFLEFYPVVSVGLNYRF